MIYTIDAFNKFTEELEFSIEISENYFDSVKEIMNWSKEEDLYDCEKLTSKQIQDFELLLNKKIQNNNCDLYICA